MRSFKLTVRPRSTAATSAPLGCSRSKVSARVQFPCSSALLGVEARRVLGACNASGRRGGTRGDRLDLVTDHPVTRDDPDGPPLPTVRDHEWGSNQGRRSYVAGQFATVGF